MTSTSSSAKKRFVREPVGWLLGPELIGKLRKIFRRRSDPRDWMPYYRGSVHDECWNGDGRIVSIVEGGGGIETGIPGNDAKTGEPKVSSAETVVSPPVPASDAVELSELWFDYIADMGDGGDPMYAIAYATMVSLEGDTATATWASGTPYKPLTRIKSASLPSDPSRVLPRGAFLFCGGDTAYHVADGPTLRARVEEPFGWAFRDAVDAGYIANGTDPQKRPYRIYGIPGNHDWYDNLDGFSLVFRLGSPSSARAEVEADPIHLPQLARVQLASYVGIQLPQGWQIWGLDLDTPMDPRQRSYFQSLGAPERLIVATPSPAIVFGAALADDHHIEALSSLGIPMPSVPVKPDAVKPRYRLDVSGDVHHYARYYPQGDVTRYSSVISGLGGAFHHPTFTRARGAQNKIEPVREYPKPDESMKACGAKLLTPRSTWFGSWARVIPFALTAIFGFAGTRSIGGGWLLAHLLSLAPGLKVPAPAGGGTQLWRAFCAVGVLGVAVFGVWAALALGKRVYANGLNAPARVQNVVDLWKNRKHIEKGLICALFDTRRSYWFAWFAGAALATPFLLYALWAPKTESLRLDIAVMIIVFALPIVAVLVSCFKFGAEAPFGERALITVTGLLHALAQIATGIVMSRLFTVSWRTAVVAAGVFVVGASLLFVARAIFHRRGRLATLLLMMMAAAVVGGMVVGIPCAANGEFVKPDHWYWDALRYFVSGVAAMPLGTLWFVWYLAICGRLDAHNNEVGGAARVTQFRELIRFHVHPEGLTGYVIAVENDPDSTETAAHAAGENLVFKLIDVFTIPTEPWQRTKNVRPAQPGPQELGVPT